MVQSGIGLSEETMARVDRLRACYGKSRSWVIEQVLTNGEGLAATESLKRAEIKRFNALAAKDGVSWQEYAQWYAAQYSRMTYPPTVDELERLAELPTASK